MKKRLPLITEEAIAKSKLACSELSQEYQTYLSREGGALSCRKHCSACCHHPVKVSAIEGLRVRLWLEAKGLWTRALQTRVEQVAAKTEHLPVDVWALSNIPCPLLGEDSLCLAYEARPFVCRITYSIGDPAECHPHIRGAGMLPRRGLLEAFSAEEGGAVTYPLAVALLDEN
jgi:Fe-S-cluster containining protein